MKRQKKKKQKTEFSKKICIFTLILFVFSILIAIGFSYSELPTDIFIYAIPACGTIAAASVGFYYNKAKYENLSKQKLRNVLLKLVLQEKLDEESYMEISDEIDHIDDAVDSKINNLFNEAIEEESNPIV